MRGNRQSIAVGVVVTLGVLVVGYFILRELLATLAPTNWFAAILAPAFATPDALIPAFLVVAVFGIFAILRGR